MITTRLAARWGRSTVLLAASALAAAISACGDDGAAPDDGLTGGLLVTFEDVGETFKVWVTSEPAIQQILDLQAGRSQANIPNGAIRAGPGEDDHNAPWSWHLDGADLEMAELTVEVCDGRPSFVEDHLADYLALGRYCPWGARLVAVDDRR